MCLVEIGEMKDGKPVLQPRVVPGCQQMVKDGTVVVTDSKSVKEAQEQVLEGLLINHPLDCPVCDKAGECKLQDYSYGYGHAETRLIDDKNTPPNKPNLGPNVALFTDRCIMCSRCVRFTREISGEAELHIVNRGSHEEIDIFPGDPLDNKLATNVVDLCPVGALCSKDFLYKHRVWNLKTVQSVCPDCSTGCSIELDGDKSIVYRLRPRDNPLAQGHFMCDEGRLGYGYVNAIERFRRPMVRKDGKPEPKPWPDTINAIRKGFLDAAGKDAGAGRRCPFAVPDLRGGVPARQVPQEYCPRTCVWRWVRCRSVGQDDTYPKDRRGRPAQPVKFTIRAEKCPNRKGVEAVLRHFQGEVIRLRRRGEIGVVRQAFKHSTSPPAIRRARTAGSARARQSRCKNVPLVVCHDLLPSPVSSFAQYILPGSSFAEKDGTFVNHAGLAQELTGARRQPARDGTTGQVFLDLLERRGLVHVPTLRKELAAEVAVLRRSGRRGLGRTRYPPGRLAASFCERWNDQRSPKLAAKRGSLRSLTAMYSRFRLLDHAALHRRRCRRAAGNVRLSDAAGAEDRGLDAGSHRPQPRRPARPFAADRRWRQIPPQGRGNSYARR